MKRKTKILLDSTAQSVFTGAAIGSAASGGELQGAVVGAAVNALGNMLSQLLDKSGQRLQLESVVAGVARASGVSEHFIGDIQKRAVKEFDKYTSSDSKEKSNVAFRNALDFIMIEIENGKHLLQGDKEYNQEQVETVGSCVGGAMTGWLPGLVAGGARGAGIGALVGGGIALVKQKLGYFDMNSIKFCISELCELYNISEDYSKEILNGAKSGYKHAKGSDSKKLSRNAVGATVFAAHHQIIMNHGK